MLLRFFKNISPIVIISIPIFAIVLWLPVLLFPNLSEHSNFIRENQTPLFIWLTKWLSKNYYLNILFAIVLLLSQAFFLLKLNLKYIFIEKRSYLPALFFILISSSIVSMQNLNSALFANLFVLFAIDKSIFISKETQRLKSYFESGLLISIATLIHLSSLYLLSIIWLSLFLIRPRFNWREWIASIVGFITPIFIYGMILYLQNDFLATFSLYKNSLLNLSQNFPEFSFLNTILLIIFGIILFIAVLFNMRLVGIKKINTRKYFSLFFWILTLTLPVFFIESTGSINYIYIAGVPISIILSMFFTNIGSKIAGELFFIILIICILGFIWI